LLAEVKVTDLTKMHFAFDITNDMTDVHKGQFCMVLVSIVPGTGC